MNKQKLIGLITIAGLGGLMWYIIQRQQITQAQTSSIETVGAMGQAVIVTPPAQTSTTTAYSYVYNINLEAPSMVTPQLASSLQTPQEFFNEEIKGDTKTTKTTTPTVLAQYISSIGQKALETGNKETILQTTALQGLLSKLETRRI